MRELGVAGYDVAGWSALLGPAALPPPTAERIFEAIRRAYADPALQQRFVALGLEADLRGPAALAALLREDDARWAAAAAAGQIVRVQ